MVGWTYKIKSITGKDGNERTDGRYPSRIGCIGRIYFLEIGKPMVFEYLKDNQGNEKCGYLRSSTIENYDSYENGTTVYTMNSVYYLEKVGIN